MSGVERDEKRGNYEGKCEIAIGLEIVKEDERFQASARVGE